MNTLNPSYMRPVCVTVPVTGYNCYIGGICRDEFRPEFEGYCLDAPSQIVNGVTRGFRERLAGRVIGQALFNTRPGCYRDDGSHY